MTDQGDMKRHAEVWALADDENMRHLLVWQRVKKRAEAGGFNGMLASDFRHADQALAALTADISAASDEQQASTEER